MTEPEYFPYDSPLRWLINSKTDSNASYLVDIGIPHCQCTHFRCDIQPKLNKGLKSKVCSHIDIANKRYLVWSVSEFKKRDINNL